MTCAAYNDLVLETKCFHGSYWYGAGNMSEDSAHTQSAASIAASLAQFTEKVFARRGIEQSNLLFGGQIGPATKALSARTSSIGVGDKAPDFSLPTAAGGIWSLGEHLAHLR